MTKPSVATIKRLFAVSGNRCAFPKCPSPMIHQGKVTGRICHIKGARPGSARYDENQGDDERYAFENLIIMCPIHHDVIDDDEVAYSVDRLLALKLDHEARQETRSEISDSDAQQLLLYLTTTTTNQSFTNVYNQNVSSNNQRGGITAHTVNIAKPRRSMSDQMKGIILAQCPRDKEIVVWFDAGNEESYSFAKEIFNFMQASGFKMFGNEPSGNIFLKPQRGVTFRPGAQYNDLYVGFPDGSEQPARL